MVRVYEPIVSATPEEIVAEQRKEIPDDINIFPLLHNGRPLLQQVNLLCQRVRRVLFRQLAFGLEQDSAPVIIIIYYMYGYAAFLFMVGDNGFVDMMPIHPLAAIIWKQRRVYINNVVGIRVQYIFRDKPKKARQYHPVYLMLL